MPQYSLSIGGSVTGFVRGVSGPGHSRIPSDWTESGIPENWKSTIALKEGVQKACTLESRTTVLNYMANRIEPQRRGETE